MTMHATSRDLVHGCSPWRSLSRGLARAALVALACLTLACGKSDGAFRPCVATPDCSGGRECYSLGSGAGICLSSCPEGQALCAQGEACAPAATGTDWACLPGGGVAIGGVCIRSLDCDLGGLCVADAGFSLCRRACDPRLPNCLAGTVCQAWTEERGYCAPAPVSVDMGMSSADAGS